jgi:hypothetical protein
MKGMIFLAILKSGVLFVGNFEHETYPSHNTIAKNP